MFRFPQLSHIFGVCLRFVQMKIQRRSTCIWLSAGSFKFCVPLPLSTTPPPLAPHVLKKDGCLSCRLEQSASSLGYSFNTFLRPLFNRRMVRFSFHFLATLKGHCACSAGGTHVLLVPPLVAQTTTQIYQVCSFYFLIFHSEKLQICRKVGRIVH